MKRIIKNYMVDNPIVIKGKDTLTEVIELFESTKVSYVIVVDELENITGIISKTDLLERLKYITNQTTGSTYTQKYLSGIAAEDIMTRNPIVLKSEDSLEYAAELLLQKQFHSLPVIKANEPIGIVTIYDVMKAYYEEVG